MIEITTREEYEICIERGFQPLKDWRRFRLNINLRKDIQDELFGTSSFQTANQKFYKWCWENSLQICEETASPLHYYSSVHISHIISKGADRRMAIDPRNVNILSYKQHMNWEFGKRENMNIYRMNKYIIQELRQDYNI